jgi:hypothetical protein
MMIVKVEDSLAKATPLVPEFGIAARGLYRRLLNIFLGVFEGHCWDNCTEGAPEAGGGFCII